MFDATVFKPLTAISVTLNSSINSLIIFFSKPFSGLVAQANEIAEAALAATGFPKSVTWDYTTDVATGLQVLKAEKNPEALSEIRQIADALFK